MSEMSFEQMLEESLKTIRNGEVVEGTVIDVKPDEIILNTSEAVMKAAKSCYAQAKGEAVVSSVQLPIFMLRFLFRCGFWRELCFNGVFVFPFRVG